jgi:hypothetical protein
MVLNAALVGGAAGHGDAVVVFAGRTGRRRGRELTMKRIATAGWVMLGLLAAGPVPAAEPDAGREKPPARLAGQIRGYWAIDLESPATVAMMNVLAAGLAGVSSTPEEEVLEELKAELPLMVFEFTADEMVVHQPGEVNRRKMTITSEDPATGTLKVTTSDEGVDEDAAILVIAGDKMTLKPGADSDDEGELGLKRIDEASFRKIRAAAAEFDKEEQDEPEFFRPSMEDGEDDPFAKQPEPPGGGDYPVGVPVPEKPGFVFSPYDNHVVDVRGIPKGTLVADPNFELDEKKYFRVP